MPLTQETKTRRSRTTGAKAAEILDEAARRRRRTIRWPTDASWLREITPAPQRVLSRMKSRGLLYGAGTNRYVIAPHGTISVEQAAARELLVDLVLGPRGPYYVGFLSSLIAHRLTDLHSELIYAAVPEGKRPRKVPPGLKIAELSPAAWPGDGTGEIERVRMIEGTKEFAFRTSLERSLIDGLLRPDLCGGFETVVSAWARAARRSDVSWDDVALIARRIGDATSRRTAFMLGLLGFDAIVDRHFAELEGRKTNTVLDRSRGFTLEPDELERDPRTGVVLNVPRSYLRGWIQGAAIG